MIYSFENASFRDKETGLYNEAYFMEIFYREWHRMIREHHALSVLVIHPNIDIQSPIGMKDFIHLAQLLDNNTKRTTDLVSRFHTNEFIIGLFDLTAEGTTTIIKRILEAIKISNEHNQLHSSSAFIGGLNIYPNQNLDICNILEEVETMTNVNARRLNLESAFELRHHQMNESVIYQ